MFLRKSGCFVRACLAFGLPGWCTGHLTGLVVATVLTMMAGLGAPPTLLSAQNGAEPMATNGNQQESFDALAPVKVVQPAYPKGAGILGLQGRVTLLVAIARDGSVSHVRVEGGSPRFFTSAVDAVKQWRYQPSERDDRSTLVTVCFSRNRQYAAPPPLEPVSAVRPEYPPSLRAAGIQGGVTLLLRVEPDGRVSNVESLVGEPRLAAAADRAVREWHFAPRNQPVETQVTLDFTLPKDESGEAVVPPFAIYSPEPESNRQNSATVAKSQGTVQLHLTVRADGTIGDVTVVKSPDKQLDDEAVRTVKTWKFLPALKAGNPVPYETDVGVVFRVF